MKNHNLRRKKKTESKENKTQTHTPRVLLERSQGKSYWNRLAGFCNCEDGIIELFRIFVLILKKKKFDEFVVQS